MRRPQLALTLAATALALAACTSSSAPAWTYAPPTVAPSVAPSASGSGAPSGSGQPSGSEAPSGGGSAAPSGSGGAGEAVQISALNIAFEQTDVTAPADSAFTISFDNKEAVPHNVEIKDGSGASVFKGDIVTGPKVTDYQVPALKAGSYTFNCSVHPNMTGTLTVGS
jgi:plastocyanin